MVGILSAGNSDNQASIVADYDDFYDESIVEWRELGARYKSQNIFDLINMPMEELERFFKTIRFTTKRGVNKNSHQKVHMCNFGL